MLHDTPALLPTSVESARSMFFQNFLFCSSVCFEGQFQMHQQVAKRTKMYPFQLKTTNLKMFTDHSSVSWDQADAGK